MAKQKHVDWFRQGARELRAIAHEQGKEHLLPSDADWYLCPLCLDGMFTVDELDTGRLTVEHAPPKSLGGREVALTCKTCNNFAGSKFDAEAQKQDRLQKFFSGESGVPEIGTLTFGEATTRVEMHINGHSSIFAAGIPKINNPTDLEVMEKKWDALHETQDTDSKFTFTPRIRHSPNRARVSWARTAYLTAFAIFGWKYILRSTLQPLRDQFINPSSITIPPLNMHIPDADQSRKEVWVIKKPIEHHSLLFIWGSQRIFLPAPNDTTSLEELSQRLNTRSAGPVHYSFSGDILSWPSRPEHVLDPLSNVDYTY